MPRSQLQHARRSIVASTARVHRDGAITAAGKKWCPEIGLADFPIGNGSWITKAPGVGQDICLGSRSQCRSYRHHRGQLVETTKHAVQRQRRPLPRRRLIDFVYAFSPGVQNVYLSVAGGLPWDCDLLKLSDQGSCTVTDSVTQGSASFAFGTTVPPREVRGKTGSWTFSMCRQYLEVRRGDYFERLEFDRDAQLWMRFVQLSRVRLNKNIGGVIFRPDEQLLIPASPHPFLVDATRAFELILADGTRVTKGRDWWVQIIDPTGTRHECVYYEGAWRWVIVGVEGYHLVPVLGEKQLSANCQGILDVHRNGSCRIQGCGLVFPEGDEIDIRTPDLVAYRPAGPEQMLTISDGEAKLVAQYDAGGVTGEEQWFVGGVTPTPPQYVSVTPLLLLALFFVVGWMLRLVWLDGISSVLSTLNALLCGGSLFWTFRQGCRGALVALWMVRNYLHARF